MKALRFTTARAISVALGCVSLAACATASEPRIVTQTVKVPVIQKCVPADLPQKPSAYADDELAKTAPADERYLAIATANQQRRARLAQLEPIISGCR